MKKLLAIALNHPRACLAALAGVVLAYAATRAGWSVYDRILAVEARQQAAAGQSEAVAATRTDWPAALGPVALVNTSFPAEEARRVASAKIDLAIRKSERGDPQPLLAEGRQLLLALRNAEGVPTAEGSRWARWMAERLSESVAQLPVRERLGLLTEAEKTLATLAASAQRAEPEPAPPTPTLVVDDASKSAAIAESLPAPKPPEPAPLPPIAVSKVAVRPLTVAPTWQPEWQPKPNDPSGDSIPDLTERTPTVAARTPTLAESTDRALLRRFIALTNELGPEPTAAGPTSLASPAETDDPTRLRLRAVRAELARRGFRGVTAGEVNALLSSNPDVRLALVDRLLSAPSSDAVRLLMLLASDQSADVRAAAISGLGSSSSRTLVQTAWELATQDDDYRVGRLAEALRQRLR